MQELDLRAVFFLLFTRIKWLILSAVAGIVLFAAVALVLLPDQYTSTAMLYLTNIDEEVNVQAATSSNLSAAERLVKTVQTATTAPWALQQASQELNGEIAPGEISSSLKFSAVAETSFLKISATHTDPVMAQKLCNVLANTAVSAFSATGETGKASVYQSAVTATKTSPNVPRMMLLGGVIGFMLTAIIIILSSLLNNTVCDKEDIQRRLNIPVLGEIPSFELVAKGGKRHHV